MNHVTNASLRMYLDHLYFAHRTVEGQSARRNDVIANPRLHDLYYFGA